MRQGRMWSVEGFQYMHIHILKHFAVLFLVSSGSYDICLSGQRNEHHIWQDEAFFLVAAFQKHWVINDCRERSITRQCLAISKSALRSTSWMMGNPSTFSRHNNYTDGTTASSADGRLELGRVPESFLERRTRKMAATTTMIRRQRRKRIIRRSLAR